MSLVGIFLRNLSKQRPTQLNADMVPSLLAKTSLPSPGTKASNERQFEKLAQPSGLGIEFQGIPPLSADSASRTRVPHHFNPILLTNSRLFQRVRAGRRRRLQAQTITVRRGQRDGGTGNGRREHYPLRRV